MRHACHLSSVHPALDTRILYRECSTLVQAGYKVTYVCQNENEFTLDGVLVKALSRATSRFTRILFTARKIFFCALDENADIYHFHDPELIIVGILLKLSGKRVIYDIHEDYPASIASNDRRWLLPSLCKPMALLVLFFEWCAAFLFDGIITATPSIAKRFPVSKTVVIQNFPKEQEFSFKDSSAYQERPLQLAYVGVISEKRGIQQMIEAVELTAKRSGYNIRLNIAGTFSDLQLEEKTKKLSGWKYVDYDGYKSREQVMELLCKARAGLAIFHPAANHINAQPNKLFEYMGSKLPVIASNFPLWRRIIKDGEERGILVDPLNSEDIACAIEWLFAHPKEAETMGERGYSAVCSCYNWKKESEKLIHFYKTILR